MHKKSTFVSFLNTSTQLRDGKDTYRNTKHRNTAFRKPIGCHIASYRNGQ